MCTQVWPRPDIYGQGQVTELPKLRKLHFSRSISSAVFAWSSKLMVGGDSMGSGLQLVRARFSNFLIGKLSREFKLRGMKFRKSLHWLMLQLVIVIAGRLQQTVHAGGDDCQPPCGAFLFCACCLWLWLGPLAVWQNPKGKGQFLFFSHCQCIVMHSLQKGIIQSPIMSYSRRNHSVAGAFNADRIGQEGDDGSAVCQCGRSVIYNCFVMAALGSRCRHIFIL